MSLLQTEAEQPRLSQALVTLLLSGKRRTAVLRRLDKYFLGDWHRYGLRRAHLLYTMRALHDIWPVLRRPVGRLVGWGALMDIVHRYFSGA